MSEDLKTSTPDDANETPLKKPVLIEKGEISEFMQTALLAIAIALVIRSIFFEPFNIPSGSMKPTLLIGDYLFVNKPAYGYSRFSFPFGIAPIEERIWSKEPTRGDVIVFALPTQTSINYIKRVIGLPGETIQVKRGRLYINGKMIQREFIGLEEDRNELGEMQTLSLYTETLPNGVKHSIYETSDKEHFVDNTPLYTIPEGHYFMMGDNRDHSQDSRFADKVGPVPFENIVGRADFLFFSTNGYAQIFELWKWPWTIRYDRLLMDIDPKHPKKDTPENKQ